MANGNANAYPELARRSGLLAWAAQNTVAANLLMVLIFVGGITAMVGMKQEIFPEIDTNRITVQVPYPGASPAEVEEGVVMRIEEELAGIEGVDRLRAIAAEGVGTVIVELEDYADNTRVLNDVESAVARIDTFPEQIERPIIAELSSRVQVISVVLHGDVQEATLKHLSERVRDDLTAMDNISIVQVGGMRRQEISIETSEAALRRYGLSFDAVAEAVGRASIDLPGGSLRTQGGEILLRTMGQAYVGREFEDIVVLSRPDGTAVRLRDVANVRDTFEESDIVMFFDSERAAMVNVYAVGEQDSLDVARTVHAYVDEVRAQLPAGVTVATWFDRSSVLQERIELLRRNAMIGLTLVFLVLTLFLDLRLAVWTAMTIPISFLGAFVLLPYVGMSINMISLFAFIVVLGIVVDAAIVVGENIFEKRQQGLGAIDASIVGVRELASPVVFTIMTTVVAFLPLLFTTGTMGQIMRDIPLVVILVLLASLVAALIILPAQLSGRSWERRSPGPLARLQGRVRDGLHRFIHGPYLWFLRRAVTFRYVTLSAGVAILLVTAGFVAGGHIRFVFWPHVDADNVIAQLEMPQGTPVEQTERVVRRIEAAAGRVRERLDADGLADGRSMFRHVSTTIGQQPFSDLASGEMQTGAAGAGGEAHLAEVNIELLSGQHRDVASATIAGMWREEVGELAGITSLEFSSELMAMGEAINVELSHPDFETLLVAVEELMEQVDAYAGVGDLRQSYTPGKREVQLELTDVGRASGLTLMDVARQVRQGFYGEEVQRVQRGREDMRVMVRYPEADRQSLADIEQMRIRLPDGLEAPLSTVARATLGRGFAHIDRADRRRVVSVTADVDEAIGNSTQINQDLFQTVLPELRAKYPGLIAQFEGEQAERADSMASLRMNFVVALIAIFALLGMQFRSYMQPLIVMVAIPFGLVGAVGGHMLMGLDLSFLSGFGVVALAGVVVNGSLIMIDLVNRERDAGIPLRRAVLDCGTRRFRPILLTTLTTFCGLTPMILERSLQARFLVPMAVSLAFGVLFATLITLVLVPALYMILEDVKNALRWIFAADESQEAEEPEEEQPAAT